MCSWKLTHRAGHFTRWITHCSTCPTVLLSLSISLSRSLSRSLSLSLSSSQPLYHHCFYCYTLQASQLYPSENLFYPLSPSEPPSSHYSFCLSSTLDVSLHSSFSFLPTYSSSSKCTYCLSTYMHIHFRRICI